MSPSRLSIGLLFGGQSPEHEVSIVSARSIASHLDPDRFEVRPIGIARNGVWTVSGDPFAGLTAGERPASGESPFLPFGQGCEATPLPEVFFKAIHGAGGEDGQLQGYLEALDRPYTGAGLLAMALTMDKAMTKRVWEAEGLPVVPWVGLTEEAWHRDRGACLRQLEILDWPRFVKPANLGSSIGISKAVDLRGLEAALDLAFGFDRRVLVEQGVDGRELETAGFGGDDPIISPVGEVLVAGEFYDFNDKYVDGKSRTQIPAAIPQEIAQQVRTLAHRAWRAVDAHGLARIDFFLCRRTGLLYLNEINMIPGFTSISMYPKLMEAAGIPYSDLLGRLVDLALERHRLRKGKQRDFSSGSNWYS